MSHFTEMEVPFLQKNESDLVAALEGVFGAGRVEVHEEGAPLFGYQGDNRAEKKTSNPNYAPPCHVIVRRKNVGSAANDVGYRRTDDGKYVAYISEYDQGANFSKAKQGRVAQEYTLRVSEKNLKAMGYLTKRVAGQNGSVKIEASAYK